MIKIKNINKSFYDGNTENRILKNISINIEQGNIFGIVGLSGCGKSTLVKLLLGLIEPHSGTIEINKLPLKEYLKSAKIQPVFQNNYELVNPLRSIKSMLNEVANQFNKDEDDIVNLLNKFRFSDKILNQKGYQLSGGEQQKIAFIKTLLADPDIFVLDEIFSAQDNESKKIISEILLELKKDGKTIILVSHNISLIKQMVDDAIILFNGEIIERGNLNEIFKNPRHDYTRLLIKSENYELTEEELKSIESI